MRSGIIGLEDILGAELFEELLGGGTTFGRLGGLCLVMVEPPDTEDRDVSGFGTLCCERAGFEIGPEPKEFPERRT